MNTYDRRRARVATVFTVVALLALVVFNRDAEPNITVAVGGQTTLATVPSTTYVPQTPAFVGGESGPASKEIIQIAVPAAPGSNNFRAIASYRRFVDTLERPCSCLRAPDTAILTVTNVDNGQTTVCTNTLTVAVPKGIDIIIDTEVFAEISDVSDAPIPVRVSW